MGTGHSAIQGVKSTPAGTYLAEQTSPTTFTLIGAQEGSRQQRAASSGSSTKQSFSPTRNKRAISRDDVCTRLPALAKLEPLLDYSEDAFWPAGTPLAQRVRQAPIEKSVANNTPADSATTAQSSTGVTLGSTELEGAGAASRSNNTSTASKYKVKEPPRDPEKVFERLYKARKKRGAPEPGPRGALPIANEDDGIEDDFTSWLFQHREASGGSTTPAQWSLSLDSGGQSRESPNPSRSSSRARGHVSHHALFDDALHRSGSACRANSPHGGRYYAPTFLADTRSKGLEDQLVDIQVLPEDSVKTFFEDERRRQEESRRQSAIDEKKENRRSLLHQAVGMVREERKASKSNTEEAIKWDGLLDSVMQAKRISPAAREACEAMRQVVLGLNHLQNDPGDRRHKERSYLSPLGTEDQVFEVWRFWRCIDNDNSGRVDFREFKSHLSTLPKDIAALAEKSMKNLLMKKSSFSVEDVLKVCWPCATFKEVSIMKGWLDDFSNNCHRRPTPPLLGDDGLQDLIDQFSFFDEDQSGSVTCQELLESNLLDAEQATRFMKDFDADGSGEISLWEFCEMFCPLGFRAYPEAQHATDDEGNRLIYEEGYGWRAKVEAGGGPKNVRSAAA